MAPISHGIVLLLQRFIYITDSFSALVSRDSESFGWILEEKEKREQGNENRTADFKDSEVTGAQLSVLMSVTSRQNRVVYTVFTNLHWKLKTVEPL